MALADRVYGTHINMEGLQIKNHRLHNVFDDPDGLISGIIWFDETDDYGKVYDGFEVRRLWADDDDFYNRVPLVSSGQDDDQILIADASNAYGYRRVTRADFLFDTFPVVEGYSRVIAQSGIANLDADEQDEIAISGDGTVLQSVGATAGGKSLTMNFLSQSANLVFAGPSSGAATTPTFRRLVDADMPATYDPTNWDLAYAHISNVSNPHSVTYTQVGAEAALGNPTTDGYHLASTVAGVRSWVDPNLIGGNPVNSNIISPGLAQDGDAITWNNTTGEFEMTNVTGSSGVTVAGTPAADQIAIWVTAASITGVTQLTTDFTTNSIVTLAAASTNDPIYRLSDGTNYFDIYLDTSAGDSFLSPYGDLIITPDATGHVAIGTTVYANTLLAVTNDTGTARTNIAAFVDSSLASVLTIAEDGTILAPQIGGTGTGTSMLYYNRTTGEITYADAPGSTSLWQKTGTSLHPTTSGDDILLSDDTERILFGDGDTYIYESADDRLRFYVGGSQIMHLSDTYAEFDFYIRPTVTSTTDIGAPLYFWEDLYAERWYVEDVNTYIYKDASDNLVFVDNVTGSKTLAELATDTVYTHPNHTGQVTSTGDGATALTVTAITAQPELTIALDVADELLVNDGGVLKRMDIGVIEDYMQDHLTFGSGDGSVTEITVGNGMVNTVITTTGSVVMGTPTTLSPSTINQVTTSSHTHNIDGYVEIVGVPVLYQVGVWNSATGLTGDTDLLWDGTDFTVSGSITLLVGATVDTIETTLTDDDTHLATSGAVYDAIAAQTHITVDNQAQYRVITATATPDVLNAEQYMTFDGSLLLLSNGAELDQFGRDLKIGADFGSWTSRTDATVKAGQITVPHYTNAEEDVVMLRVFSGPTLSVVGIGGGDTTQNAVTDIGFYAAANTTTLTGTLIAEIDIDGFKVDNIYEQAASSGVSVHNEFYLPDISGTGTGTSVLRYNRTTGQVTYADGFAGTFLSLSDTPANYSGAGGYFVRVNAGATGLEFTSVAAQIQDLTDLANGGMADFTFDGSAAVAIGLDFTNLTNETTLAAADEFAFYDDGVGMRAITYDALVTALELDLGVDIGNTGEVPYSNTGTPGDNFNYNSGLVFDGTRLIVPQLYVVNSNVAVSNVGSDMLLVSNGTTAFQLDAAYNISYQSLRGVSDGAQNLGVGSIVWGYLYVNQITTRSYTTASGRDLSMYAGGSSSATGTHDGGNLTLRGGNQTNAAGGDGGNVYMYGGSSIAGTRGEVYFGDGSTFGSLQERTTETQAVYYDIATGLLTYGDGTGLAGAGFSDYGADQQIPYMNGTTSFDYSNLLRFDDSTKTLLLGESALLTTEVTYITTPDADGTNIFASNLKISTGDAVNVSTSAGGDIIIKPGDAYLGTSSTGGGQLYLSPGNPYSAGVGYSVYIGAPDYNSSSVGLTGNGSLTNVNFSITTKGNGKIDIGTSSSYEIGIYSGTKVRAITPIFEIGQYNQDGTVTSVGGTGSHNDGLALYVRSGDAYQFGGAGSGGPIYIYGGNPYSTGDRGSIYFGDGTSIGGLQARSSEGNVVYYDTTTGLLTYGDGSGLSGAGFSDYGADTQIPYMNGTTDFAYSDGFTFDDATYTLTVGLKTTTVTNSYIVAPNGTATWVNGGDLHIYGGDPYNTAGADAGDVTIKGGNALSADSGSAAGRIYLVPGNPYQSFAPSYVTLGNYLFSGSSIWLSPEGTQSAINILIRQKGTGNISLGTGGGGGITLSDPVFMERSPLRLGNVGVPLDDFEITGGDGGASHNTGINLIIKGGDAYPLGDTDGGSLYLYGGDPNGAGARGLLYFGDGTSIATLNARTSEGNVVYYDTTTGLLTYGDGTGLSGAGFSDYGTDQQIPFMNGTTDFAYSDSFLYDDTFQTLTISHISSNTDSSQPVLELARYTSGTAADGIGVKMIMSVQSDLGAQVDAEFNHILVDATDGAETSVLILRGQNIGGGANLMGLTGGGTSNSTDFGVEGIAIGVNARTVGSTGAIAIGHTTGSVTGTKGNYPISIGHNANGSGTSDIGVYGIAIGYQAKSQADGGLSIGYNAGLATGTVNPYAISIGYDSNSGIGKNIGNSSIAIGGGADAVGHNSIVIGSQAGDTSGTASSYYISIGRNSNGGSSNIGNGSIAIGDSTAASAQGAIMMGFHSSYTEQLNDLTNSFKLAWNGTTGFHVGLTLGTQITVNADPVSNLSAAANGALAYDSTDHEVQAYINGAWQTLATGSGFSDYGADQQIPYMNGTTDFDYSAGFLFDDATYTLTIGEKTAADTSSYITAPIGTATYNTGGDLYIRGGAPYNTAGADAGDIIIKAGDARTSDVSSLQGLLYLNSGNHWGSNASRVYFGDPTYTQPSIYLQPAGTSANISLYLEAKGTGTLWLNSAGNGQVVVGDDLDIRGNYISVGTTSIVSTMQHSTEAAFHIVGGGTSVTDGDGFPIYIYGGYGNGSGLRGQVYLGNGSTIATLRENASPTHAVTYNTTTGLLNWTAVGDLGSGFSDYGADQQIPYMNSTTDFDYTDNFRYDDSVSTLYLSSATLVATIATPDGPSADARALDIKAGSGTGTGFDGGNVNIKSGAAYSGDATSLPGEISIVPGNRWESGGSADINIGNTSSTLSAYYFKATSHTSVANVALWLNSKGTGVVNLSSPSGYINLIAGGNYVYLQTTNVIVNTSSNTNLGMTTRYQNNGADLNIIGQSITGSTGDFDGGSIFIRPGTGLNNGADGSIYFGDGTSVIFLEEDVAATEVVTIDTTTGLLSYITASSLGGFSDYGADTQIPYMNGTTDFAYTDNFIYDDALYLLKLKGETATNIMVPLISLYNNNSAGVGGNNLGVGTSYYLENSAGIEHTAGNVYIEWQSATSTSEFSRFVVSLIKSGAQTNVIYVSGSSATINADGLNVGDSGANQQIQIGSSSGVDPRIQPVVIFSGDAPDFRIFGGGNLSTTATDDAGHLILAGGNQGGTGGGNGGSVYMYGGTSVSGSAGELYLGTGAAGALSEDATETEVVTYDTATGLLSYRQISGLGSGFSDYGADTQIPYMNGTTDFAYSDGFTFDDSTYTLTVGLKTATASSSYITAPDGTASYVDGGDLYILGGDPYDTAGADSGDIIIKAGNARSADSGSISGRLYLSPGNTYQTSTFADMYFGSTDLNSSSLRINTAGTESNISLYIRQKGSGQLSLGNYTGGAVILNAGPGDIYLDTATIHLGTASSDTLIYAYDGDVGHVKGYDLTIKAGRGYIVSGDNDGGDLLLYGGDPRAAGLRGQIYFGDGSTFGTLRENASPTHAVTYNTTTGLLNWTAVGDLGGGGVTLGTAADQIPFMNTAFDDFEYSTTFLFTGTALDIGAAYLDMDAVDLRENATRIFYYDPTYFDIAIGVGALESVGAGATYNIAIGEEAFSDITGTSDGIAIGRYAGRYSTGARNIYLGYNSGSGAVGTNTGYDHIFIGYQAGEDVTSGNGSIAIGYQALQEYASQVQTIAIGYQAARYSTANYNVYIGYQAAMGATTTNTGYDNVIIGRQSGLIISNTNSTVIIGAFAGQELTGISPGNVLLGAYAAQYLNGNYNVAIGYEAGKGTTTVSVGDNNVFVGYRAGYAMQDGARNIAMGDQALSSNTAGDYNIAIGRVAGQYLLGTNNIAIGQFTGQGDIGLTSTANHNVFVGYQAGQYVTTGAYNIAIGYTALQDNLTGADNIAIGRGALANTTGSGFNVAVGNNACNIATSLTGVTAVGWEAGQNATGNYNSYFGVNSGESTGSSAGNTSYGYYSLRNSTGGYNTAVGYNAMAGVTGTAQYNVAVGSGALDSIADGNYNTSIGGNSGGAISDGTNNVVIGYGSAPTTTTGSYNIIIGTDIYTTAVGTSYQFRLGYSTTFLLEGDMTASQQWVGTTYDFRTDILDEFTTDAGITVNANVGIGAVDTTFPLTISSSTTPKIKLVLDSATDTGDPSINFYTGTTGGSQVGIVGYNYGENDLRILYGTSINGTSGIIVDHLGRVGVGGNPFEELHVYGDSASGEAATIEIQNANTNVATGTEAGRIKFWKSDTSGQGAGTVTTIYSVAADAGSSYDLYFKTGQDVITPAGTNSTMFLTYIGNFEVDAAQDAYLTLNGASTYDSAVLHQVNGTTQVISGWDTSASIFQIHTGTAFVTSATGDFSINASGNVFMANITNTTSGNYLYYDSTTKELTYNTTSDIRLKDVLGAWEPDSLGFLRAQDIIRFNWKDGKGYNQIGWNANQMSELMPELTWKDEHGYWNYYDAHMRFHFHRAIKQLDETVETHEQRIKRLEGRIEELEEQLNIN